MALVSLDCSSIIPGLAFALPFISIILYSVRCQVCILGARGVVSLCCKCSVVEGLEVRILLFGDLATSAVIINNVNLVSHHDG